MQTFLISILVFGVIIFVHEFGHFALAKLTGIRVEEFSLGMGPQIIGRQKGETLYSIRVLPLGGYCKLTGENFEENEDVPIEKRFDQKPLWARMAVIVSGSLMNFLLAAVIFALIFSVIGIPQDYTNKIGEVLPGSAAEAAGLKAGDIITSINDIPVENWTELTTVIHNRPNEQLLLGVRRETQTFTISVIPQFDQNREIGMIGIAPREAIWQRINIFDGIAKGFTETFRLTGAMIEQLILLVTGKVSAEGVAGPVGIIQLIGQSARYGLVYVANLTAVISVNLGLINLLPIPALDGGRFFFLLVEGILMRKVNPEKENLIHFLGFALLMALMIFITYKDIARLLTG